MKYVTQGASATITRLRGVALIAVLVLGCGIALGHIVPPEKLDPLAESYRRMCFLLRLNPVPWEHVARDADVVGRGLRSVAISPGPAREHAARQPLPQQRDRRRLAGSCNARGGAGRQRVRREKVAR